MAADLAIRRSRGRRDCWWHRRRCVLPAGSQGILIDPLVAVVRVITPQRPYVEECAGPGCSIMGGCPSCATR